MPNTSSAKKALRGSLKKRQFNQVKKYKLKQALKEFRRVLSTKPKEYQATLSKVFSALDKAVKTNVIPKKRADRKKSRLSAMAAKANGQEVATKKEQKLKKRTAKAAAPKKEPKTKKPAAKKTPAKKAATKKTAEAKKETAKPVAKKTTAKKTTTKKAAQKKPAAKKTTTK